MKTLQKIARGGYNECADCGGLIGTDYEWLGEDENGVGMTRHIERCEDCGRWNDEVVKGG